MSSDSRHALARLQSPRLLDTRYANTTAHKKDDVIEKVKFRKKFQKSNILQNLDLDLTSVNGFVSATVEMRGSAVKGWAVGLATRSILFQSFLGKK